MGLWQSFRSSRRRNWLINPRFQLQFVKMSHILTLGIVLINYGANEFFFYQLRQRLLGAGIPSDHLFFTFLAQQQTNMKYVLLGAAVLILLFVTVFGIFVSHRISGPLYRFERDLSTMAEKQELREINFRTRDYFQEIPLAFNRVVRLLSKNRERDEDAS